MSADLASPIRYHKGAEHRSEHEEQVIASLEEVFVEMAKTVAKDEGHAHRAVHAKGQGLLRGHLMVLEEIPHELRQGLFESAQEYDAVARFSSPPAEQLSDEVSTPRAIALKILNVKGLRAEGGGEQGSQDFLMVNNSPAFATPGPEGFLRKFRLLAMTTERMPKTKALLSKLLQATEVLLEKVGSGSPSVREAGGQPQVHPLGETYYSQVPFRYGEYIAKFSLVPVSSSLTSLSGQGVPENGDDTQRHAISNAIEQLTVPAEWELRVQLCRDFRTMPIEDASVVWPEDASPYQPVARLRVSAQQTWDSSTSPSMEDAMAFSPWNALAAHQPLGALNRARRVVMKASREFRSGFNQCPIHEPKAEEDQRERSDRRQG